jgi:acyl-coenzyme A thioesterase 9
VALPQQRNLSGRIFGGFLLRRAFELAFATTYVFGGAKPKFHSVADMNFLRPVEVGDLMRVRARVLHSAQTSCGRPVVDVEVEALVTKPESMQSEVSNTFMFKFYVGERNEGRVARRVLPSSREEAAHVWEKCVRPGVQVKLEEQTP